MDKINKDMTFGELLQGHPEAAPVLADYGLHCIGCHIGVTETLEQGIKAHGMDDLKVTEIVEKLNSLA